MSIMYQPIQIKTSVRNSMNHPPSWRALLLVALASLALSPIGRAVTPPPDGGYPGDNTAEGEDALFSLTDGADNTAVGFNTLYLNTTGDSNTATGAFALQSNTTGSQNTANGWSALNKNTTGSANTAMGLQALWSNTSGSDNTATGFAALNNNTIGINNTATGFQALEANKTGNYNTANGQGALFLNTTGVNNTADGQNALRGNTTGSNNTALGASAGINLTTGSNNIDIGNAGVAGESKTIRIGKIGNQIKTFVAGISGATVPTGVPVIVDGSGHLGTTTSSARFKDAVKPMDKASEVILSLQPVTFRYKPEIDPAGIPQFGLVAEQVAKVNSDLVARDEQGKPYTVRYEAVNAMLLNEFLKAHSKIEEQGKEIVELKAALKQQAAQLEKVSSRLEARDLKDRLVDNR